MMLKLAMWCTVHRTAPKIQSVLHVNALMGGLESASEQLHAL